MAELKPCPFCGAIPKLIFIESVNKWSVECCNGLCAVLPRTYMSKEQEDAIEAWNRRVGDGS